MGLIRRAGANILRLLASAADPAAAAGEVQVYPKNVGAITQLFLRESDGSIRQLGSSGSSWIRNTTTADFVTGSATPVAIAPASGPALQFTAAANSRYAVRSGVLLSSLVAGISAQASFIWPTSLAGYGGGVIKSPNNVTAVINTVVTQGSVTSSIVASLPAITDGWLAQYDAIFETGAGATSIFALAIETEFGGSDIAVRAGSWMEYTLL